MITTRGRGTDTLQQLIAARKYNEAHERLSVSANANASINASHTALGRELSEVTHLQTQFRGLAIPSLMLIGASVIALSLVDQYAKNCLVSGSVLVVFIGWFCFILFKMERLSVAAFHNRWPNI